MDLIINAVIAAAITIPLSTWIMYKLFAKRFPYKPPPSQKHYTLEELQPKYERWERFGTMLTVVFVFPMAYIIYEAFMAMRALLLRPYSDAPFVFVPPWEWWALLALFLGIIATAIPMDFIVRWWLKGQVEEFIAYQNLQYGYDAQKAGRIILTSLGGFSALCLVFLFDWYTVFGPSEIVINPFLSFSVKRYAYSDIQRFSVERETTPENPDGGEIRLTLYFKDGSSWDNTSLSPAERKPGSASLVEFIQEQTGMILSDWKDMSMMPGRR